MSNTERPLDNMVTNGGFMRIFKSITCVGDSLSSGEFESLKEDGTKGYYDMFEYSWGQIIGRTIGASVNSFSRGGMTAKEYVESYADLKGFWDEDKKSQAYIFALGVNDTGSCEKGEISDICMEDYTKNGKTFVGYYASIIQRYKKMQPRAKFFLMTMPRDIRIDKPRYEKFLAFNEEIRKMAQLFSDTYLIDLEKYAPVYDEDFRENYFMGGHLSPAGYVWTADVVMSYIDYIIRHNMKDFKEVGFIGTDIRGAGM